MSQLNFAVRHSRQTERLLRWQVTVNTAFAGGSLIAALLNLGALIAISRFATARHVGSMT